MRCRGKDLVKIHGQRNIADASVLADNKNIKCGREREQQKH